MVSTLLHDPQVVDSRPRWALSVDPARPFRSLSSVAPAVLAGAFLYSAATVRPVSAQAAACDPSLERSESDPHGYRLRGDRCEGIYAQPVAGTPLVIASFTERFETYDPDSTRSLVVRWSAGVPGEVRLRALALRRRLYYRMDAERPASAGSWEWPADLLAALDLERPELGVVAWTRRRVGAGDRDVHLPLRIANGSTAETAEAYTLVILPQMELAEVYVTVVRVDEDGQALAYLRDEDPLAYGYYPADRPIGIAIVRPDAPGLYRVVIGARIRSGGSLTTELWFDRSPD